MAAIYSAMAESGICKKMVHSRGKLRAKRRFDNYLDRNLVLENMLGANTIPVTILIDAQGRVLGKIRGSKQWDSPRSVKLIGEAFGRKM